MTVKNSLRTFKNIKRLVIFKLYTKQSRRGWTFDWMETKTVFTPEWAVPYLLTQAFAPLLQTQHLWFIWVKHFNQTKGSWTMGTGNWEFICRVFFHTSKAFFHVLMSWTRQVRSDVKWQIWWCQKRDTTLSSTLLNKHFSSKTELFYLAQTIRGTKFIMIIS